MDDPFLRRFFDEQLTPVPEQRVRGLGSGVIVTADGYILTNHHVIDGAQQIELDLQGPRTVTAKLVGSDPPSDPFGPAADVGIQRGDVIEQVNQQPVRSVAGLGAAVERSGKDPLLLLVNHRGITVFDD